MKKVKDEEECASERSGIRKKQKRRRTRRKRRGGERGNEGKSKTSRKGRA